jgi:AraC-like DNA-binding protein
LSEDELKWQVWVIDNIGELIATAPCLSSPMPKERIRKAISACVNQTVGGKITTFAKLLGKHHKTLIRWQTGEEIPQLHALLQICHFLRISLLDFLTREVIAIDSNWIATQNQNQRQRKLEAHTRQPLDLERLRQALLAALKQEPPPTLTEVIRRLGYTGKGTFHKYFPDFCNQIKAQYTDYQKAKLEQKRLFILSVLESNEFPPLSMKEVARRIGANDAALHMQFPSLSHAISARYLQYRKMVRVQKEEQLRTEIREIALALHAQGINPHSGNVGNFLTSPIVLRNQVGNAALREVRRELGYDK